MRSFWSVLLACFAGSALAQADFPATAATTCEIAPGEAVLSDLFEDTDRDWCRVQVEPGKNYAVWIQIAGQPGQELTLPAARAFMYTAEGDLLASPGANAAVSNRTFYQATYTGDAYIEVNGNDRNSGSYRLVLSDADDIRGDENSTASLVPGGDVDAELEGWGDSDWFRIDFIAGRQYEFDLLTENDNPNLTLRENAARLTLHDETGTDVTPQFWTGASFTASATETLYLGVTMITSTTDVLTGTYRIRQSELDEAGGTSTDSIPTAAGRTIEGTTQLQADADAFGFFAGENEAYDLLIQGAGVDDLTNTHVCISLLRPDGSGVTFQCSGGGADADLSFTTDEAGTWYAVASTRFGATGTYRITISPRDDFPESNDTPGRIEPGFYVDGVIQSKADNDWFIMPLAAGVETQLELRGALAGIGTLEFTSVEVFDPEGDLVVFDRVSNNPTVSFTPGAAGDYVIRVFGYCFAFLSDCDLGTYRINVDQGPADPAQTNVFAATLPQARSVQLGEAATFFGTILNDGSETPTRCGVALSDTENLSFSFVGTNAANEVTGQTNTRIDVPAGQSQGYVLAVTPNEEFSGQPFTFDFDCANTDPAPIAAAVNGFSLSSSNDPLADLIMIAASPSNDGVARIPGADGTGFFTVAAINIGAEETLTFSATATGQASVSPVLCETDPGTGACLAALAGSLERTVANGEVVFFSVFFAGGGQTVPFDPAETRIRFNAEAAGALRGATSVAVATD